MTDEPLPPIPAAIDAEAMPAGAPDEAIEPVAAMPAPAAAIEAAPGPPTVEAAPEPPAAEPEFDAPESAEVETEADVDFAIEADFDADADAEIDEPVAVEVEVEVEPEPIAVDARPIVRPDTVPDGPIPAIPPVETAPPSADLVPLTDLASAISEVSLSRRAFLGFGLTLAGGIAGAGILTRFVPIFAEPAVEPPPIVRTYDPATKGWTFVVDSASCIGCGLCVVACKEENDVTRDPGFSRTWVERHAIAADGSVYVDSPAGGAKGFPETSTAVGAAGQTIDRAFFEPRLCMQCEDSPCTAVCPVGATYRTPEGIVLVDARRCIGCGYCVVACPYGARYLTPAGEDNPNGTAGIADKCTWCYHRISRGALPACVEVCPVGARKFGDAADPDSEVAAIVRARSGKPLHPEFGTRPRVLYLGPATEEA